MTINICGVFVAPRRFCNTAWLALLAAAAILPLTACASAPPVSAGIPPAPPSPQDQISAERPGFTNGTDTVALGHIQLETGYLLVRQSGVSQSHLNDAGQLRAPLSRNFEMRVVTPTYYFGGGNGAETGFTDSGISAKWRFLEELPGRRPSLALIGGSTVPSGSRALRASRLEPMIDLEAQMNLSSLYQLQASTSYTRSSDAGSEFGTFANAINISYNTSPAMTQFAEIYRQSSAGYSGAPNVTYLDGGTTYSLGANVQIDFNIGFSISQNDKSDRFIGAGFAQRW